MIESLGTIIEYIQATGNAWMVIALALFGVLMREINDHKKYTKEITETTINKETFNEYSKRSDALYEASENNYKLLVEMVDKLSCMLYKLTENYIVTESKHNVALAEILNTIKERLPRSHD